MYFVQEISRYRDALCYARLKGARVVDSAEAGGVGIGQAVFQNFQRDR